MAVTYKSYLLGHLDLGDNSSSYIICKASCVTDAEGVGTWIEKCRQYVTAITRLTKTQLFRNRNVSYPGL